MIPIALPCLGAEEHAALAAPLERGWLTQGREVAAFETAFAERHRVARALATTSCTTALQACLAALEIGPGDEVIVPAFTWVASANVVVHAGATPVFVDVDPATFNIDPTALGRAVTPRTRAAIIVHLFGRCADMAAVRAALPDRVAILEDAACAAGAAWGDQPAGGLGLAGCFSFHPRKVITTGEGGMVTTNDTGIADIVDRLRNHGAGIAEEQRHHGPRPWLLPTFDVVGFNFRMTDLQGAVGRVQLTRLDRFIAERAEQAARYRAELGDLAWLHLPEEPADGRHGWQAFVALLGADAPIDRNPLLEHLQDRGIGGRPGTHDVPGLGVYRRRYGLDPANFPGARLCAERSLALPLHNRLTADEQGRVIAALREWA